MKLKSKLLLLIIISIILCISNYQFGTYLSGWDTLHPEFNFGEYFKRIFSVWQEHQGLGAVAAQAYAAELPRVVVIFLLSFFLPLSLLRYAFFFITLILGPLGVYFFIKEYVSKKNSLVAFVASFFYLFNLTTLQQYTVPLEMFATLYAGVGWIFLFATKYILNHKKRNLWLFILVIIFSAPLAHTPTLFYIFFFCFSVFLLIFARLQRKAKLKPVLLLITLIITLNSYWILPNLYFIANYGSSVANSKIHSQFSDRAFEVGKNFGGLPDTAVMKNFLFDWGKYNNFSGAFVHLLDLWGKHLSNPLVKIIGNLIFILATLGFGISIFKREIIGLSLLPVFLISYFFLANDNFLFEQFSYILGKYFVTVKEALRFPFTKFSILLLFCYSVYLSLALNTLAKKGVAKILLLVIPLLLIIYMYPFFSGYLINPKMRVTIPNYYFDLFDYFSRQSADGRIAMFPVHTFWGWSYYKWSYEGAGFLWFGLKQPLLNREFDRWHPANEQFYFEISYAVYKEDIKLLESVLDKYQVKWLLLDFSITDASSAKSPYLNQISNLLKQSKRTSQVKRFGEIKVYQVDNHTDSKDFIAVGQLPSVGPVFQRADIDRGFVNHGHYSLNKLPDVFYPFRSLFTNHTNNDLDFEFSETADSFIFRKQLPAGLKNYELNIPETAGLIWFDEKNLDSAGTFLPKINSINQYLTVEVPKVKGYFSYQVDPISQIKVGEGKNCDFLRLSIGDQSGEVTNQIIWEGSRQLIRLRSKLANNCSAVFPLNNLSHNLSYLVKFEARNFQNKTLLFWLENVNLRRSDLEVYLPQVTKLTTFYFIQPPMDPFGTGYNLHFDNWSFNKNYSINDLGKISVFPIPYDFLTSISFTKQAVPTATLKSVQTLHPLPYLYIARLNEKGGNLVLYQSFDPGWYAFGASEHFLVSNWANGWKVNSTGGVVIIFLPQLLQFLGFGIFVLSFIFITKFYPKV